MIQIMLNKINKKNINKIKMVKGRTNFLKLKNKSKIYLNDLYCKNIKYKFYLNQI